MRFSYNRLWKLLIDKNINKQKLKELSGISSASVAKLRKGQNVTTNVLLNICNALDCNVEDIMEFVKYNANNLSLSDIQIVLIKQMQELFEYGEMLRNCTY